MSGVRVLRLIEYTYPTQEDADLDMSCWAIPASGSRRVNGKVIRSAIISQPFRRRRRPAPDVVAAVPFDPTREMTPEQAREAVKP